MNSRSFLNTVNKLIVSLALCASSFLQATPLQFIRDAEIEDILTEVAYPLVKAANRGPIKLILYVDEEINAFTPGLNLVFLSTGLCKTFPRIDVLRGVIAHEIGHILNHHPIFLSQFQDQSLMWHQLVSAALAAGIALNGKIDPDLLVAGSHITGHYMHRTTLKYSRDCESEADQYALKILAKSNVSTQGLIDLHTHLLNSNRHYTRELNKHRYDLTHPLSQERLSIIDNFKTSTHYKIYHDDKLQQKIQRIATKIMAFTESPEVALTKARALPMDERDYALSIAYLRLGDFDLACSHVDRLLKQDPRNPYYWELKGQIFFDFGNPTSVQYYRRASALLPKNALIRISKAIAGISLYEDNADLNEFYQDLLIASKDEMQNLARLRYLAIYYGKTHQKSKALLAMANFCIHAGRIKQGLRMANQVIAISGASSVEKNQARDLIDIHNTKK